MIPRVIPTLLIKNDGLVKTTKFKRPVYVGDPINALKIFNEKEVDELILLDIAATSEEREPNYKRIEEIVSEAFMPIGYGGGINKMHQIEKLFKVGIEKVILNSVTFSNPKLIEEATNIFGSQSIVASIDTKKNMWGKYQLFSNSGRKKQKELIENHVQKVVKYGCGEVYLNNITKDGTQSGYDLELIKKCSEMIDVPLIAAGGAEKLEDFSNAIKAGASAVSAGAMFVFQGVHRAVLISYPKYSDLEKLFIKVG